uniref:Uncharacterized protein n=1 Tax=Anopheles maculatus TaxID=74869 RepID=A0A182SGG8_9DIPT
MDGMIARENGTHVLTTETTTPKIPTDTSAQSVLPSPRTPSPHQQQSSDQPNEDDEPSYQNTEVVKAAAAAITPTTNGTAASGAKHAPETMNGNASTSTPKENGQPSAAATAEESTAPPVTTITNATGTNGTLHSHPPPSPTNRQPPPIANGINVPPTISSNARGGKENGILHATAAPTTCNRCC